MPRAPKGASTATCYREGYEIGPWYEIKAAADVIRKKEARGADATFERSLLKAWSKEKGYESAGEALKQLRKNEPSTQTSKSSDKTAAGSRKPCRTSKSLQDNPKTVDSNPRQGLLALIIG